MNTKKNMNTGEAGDTARLIKHVRAVANLGDRVDLANDPDGVRRRIADYFALCETDDVKPTVSELSIALGISRRGYYKWRTGEIGRNEETRAVLNQAQTVLDALMEGYMQNSMINPVAGIFLMRNNHGYRNEDIPSPDDTPKLPDADVQQLAEKYLADVPDSE